MGSFFRSEEMTLAQLFLQSEAAYACVSELGELGVVQFRDLNPDVNAFQRKFVNEIRRCEEMERKLRFLNKEIEKANIDVADTSECPEAPHPREMIDLEAQFEQLENEMKDSNANYVALMRRSLELKELQHVLRKAKAKLFEEAELYVNQEQQILEPSGEDTQHLLWEEPKPAEAMQLGFVTGVIARERVPSFERLLWRACRGNVFFKQAEIETPLEDPITGDEVHKCVFIIFFQGDQLKSRVKKICEGFRATFYPCPDTAAERREMEIGVMTRIEDLQTVLNQTLDHRHRLLVTVSGNISQWSVKVKKIKAIYHTMNMFNLDVTQKCLIAECWCPVSDLDSIRQALRRGTERSGASVPSILNRMVTRQEPPTFNRTNKFTRGFQAIVDAYGVASYQEVNPALYTIITFPFLFSVMFGDFGHGFIMFLFALYLVLNENKLKNFKSGGEFFDTAYSGRYIILLMGIFAIHSGLLYNDIFSKSINIFGTAWIFPGTNETTFACNDLSDSHLEALASQNPHGIVKLNPRCTYSGVPYYFGYDPIWQLAKNKLTFTNSFKMKMSVVMGVVHMMFGVVLSAFNHRHFKKPINIYCEFIPQVLFLFCTFGYLVIIIFYKWITVSVNSARQPSLLLALINMFLAFGSKIEDKDLLYPGQATVQPILVVIAVLCVPWMLLVKPFYLRHQYRKKQLEPEFTRLHRDRFQNEGEEQDNEVVNHDEFSRDNAEHAGEEFDFGDIFIHQVIHTIEYCLGCISNTASYLRLWALSLAHAELSEVLWTLSLGRDMALTGFAGAVATFLTFAAWAVETIVILLIMEGLSAFLHALRLHWVEFQNKFYGGSGYRFIPFSFKAILSGENEQ